MTEKPQREARDLDRLAGEHLSGEDLDRLELAMLEGFPVVEMPLKHRFTPGIYAREIFMKAGTLCTSKIHKIQHPFVVLEGKVSVYNVLDGSVVHLEAPHVGITEPGTRRLLYIHEDCRWITFHPNPDNTEDLDDLEMQLIERRELPDGQTVYDLWRQALKQLPPQEDFGGAP